MDPHAPTTFSSRMPSHLSRSGTLGLRSMFQITIPLDDMPPPFKDSEVNKSYDLLQNTAICRDGGRVPTPERTQVLSLASGLEKHRLRRQQQLLLDIAQRCKEQDINSMSNSLSRKCPLASFEDKYHKDMREYSTNTILFKTWGNATDLHDGNDFVEPQPTPRILFERGNTYFPARRIKKLPPKEFYMPKSTPIPQVGYSKGLQIKEPFDVDKKKALIAERKINGPIQLDLYSSPKNDKLQPLILPSIRYVGVDLDKIDTYVKSKKVKMSDASERSPQPLKAIEDSPNPYHHQGPERIIIHTNAPKGYTAEPDSNTNMAIQNTPSAPPPTVRSKVVEEATAVSLHIQDDIKEEENQPN